MVTLLQLGTILRAIPAIEISVRSVEDFVETAWLLFMPHFAFLLIYKIQFLPSLRC